MAFTSTLFLASLLLGAQRASAGYPAPAECKGACFSRDPTIIQGDSGKYWRFSTGDGIHVAQADSLTSEWEELGSALPGGSSIPLHGYTGTSLWAPDISKIGDTYYMYYSKSVIDTLDSNIGVATSTTLDIGSWTDHGSTGISSNEASEHNAIDPNLVHRPDGTYQLTFGSHVKDIWYVPIGGNMLVKGADATGPISYTPSSGSAQEGSFMYYHNDYYYLFVSAGSCCGFSESNHPSNRKEYHVTVCRSKSSTEGFVDQSGADCANGGGTTILASHDNVYAPGGEGVYNDPTYGPILYYMYYDTSIGFTMNQTIFGWNPIDFSSSWPVLTDVPQPGSKVTAAQVVERGHVVEAKSTWWRW